MTNGKSYLPDTCLGTGKKISTCKTPIIVEKDIDLQNADNWTTPLRPRVEVLKQHHSYADKPIDFQISDNWTLVRPERIF